MNTTILTQQQLAGVLEKLAGQLLSQHGDCRNLGLIGIQRRGVALAERLQQSIARQLGYPVATGSLDITLYRDDWTMRSRKPAVGKTKIPFDVEDKSLILVDDVLFTGRTIRAALEALADFGRPDKVELLVLVDRGHRELPIQPNYAGVRLATERADRVDVLVTEFDGRDEVVKITGD